MSPTEHFELFNTGKHCEVGLPINTVQDEFTFVRFASLLVQNGSKTVPTVVPRDVVNPELVAHVRDFVSKLSLPHKVDLREIRGGLSLNPDWEDWTAPSLPEIRKITIRDRNKFISDPKINIDGENYEPSLTPGNIQELTTHGTTLLTVGEDDSMMFVELSASPPAVDDNPDLDGHTVDIGDLYEFFSDPKVNIGSSGTYRVSLNEENVEELLTLGVSKMELIQNGSAASIYVTTPQPPASSEVASYRSAINAPARVYSPEGRTLEVIASLPNYEFVLYLPYRQTWELLGYSRGELLNSISLGPQEETTIEISTWDRVKRMSEDTRTAEQEGTLEATFTDKDTTETVKEMAKTFHWNFNHVGEVSVPLEMVKIKASHTFDIGEQLTNLDKTTRQTVSEAVRKASARVKMTRQTKVSESEELGREEKTTRKVKNPNMCHTLNLDYFEILGSYKVTTQLALEQVQLCVLTEQFLPKTIDRYFLLYYEGVLRDALMFADVYEKGFEAARMLDAWDRWLCDVKCKAPCSCEKLDVMQLPVDVGSVSTGDASVNPVDTAKTAVINAARALGERIGALENATPNEIIGLINDVPRWLSSEFGLMSASEKQQYDDEWQEAKVRFHRWLYRVTAMEQGSLRFWNTAKEFKNTKNVQPEDLERMIDAAAPSVLADLGNIALIAVRLHGKAIEFSAKLFCLNPATLVLNIGFDDGGLGTAFEQARRALDAYKAAVTAQSQSSATKPDDPKKKEPEEILEKAVPDYLPKDLAEAHVAEDQLLHHIEQNESYYRQAIWRALDPNDRLVSISTMGDIATFVDNEVLGFVGKKAALPFRTADNANVTKWFEDNVLENDSLQDIPDPLTVTLPTKGVMMETRLGQCDACEEFITEHRGLDLKQKAAEVKVADERAKQEQQETERYKKRLQHHPPMLEDPDPNQSESPIRLAIKQEKDS
jgi:hypothetical protein